MRHLKNTWYAAAWSSELAPDRLLARRFFDEPTVMFRGKDGPAMIADYCPHRFAPLHRGRLADGSVECGYHGLRFDGQGRCVHNPHGDGAVPAGCKVPSYRVAERHGVIWLWPGDAALADEEQIPDFSYLDAPERKTVSGLANVRAHYELIADNLMDASHTQYVHSDLLGTDAFRRSKHEVFQDGEAVHSHYLIPGSAIPAAYAAYFDDPQTRVDYSINFRWLPPGLVRNSVSLIPVDGITPGILRTGSHFMTPETELTTHYFFAHTRNFRLDDESIDERIRWWQKAGLTEQDGAMIEACQSVMGTADLESLHPVLFSIDAAAVRVRRVLGNLIDRERAKEST
ncbi:MAG TPA: aromatic ring-hydroxylating dioxygenase subunit alpha [Ramlibacter sp.]|uniref:aromatic ring-hydroxylating dioxygenase subunit alpha n=1 Tax=Ramlibacter sp. TaxID=1917967 RepID=UPI002C033016|nr:aromatic ring-hydroxylating dioxygenase subunit alpha [Ramlibacter sp.]HVZ46525.1 aromatic ring-hydroxylating dioxygenase subunit alpha [Ramlibacter sp.]